jgi:hypothetical protein
MGLVGLYVSLGVREPVVRLCTDIKICYLEDWVVVVHTDGVCTLTPDVGMKRGIDSFFQTQGLSGTIRS